SMRQSRHVGQKPARRRRPKAPRPNRISDPRFTLRAGAFEGSRPLPFIRVMSAPGRARARNRWGGRVLGRRATLLRRDTDYELGMWRTHLGGCDRTRDAYII